MESLIERDYYVFKEIRETWKGDKLKLFLGKLFETYSQRTKEPELLFLQYQPGDYIDTAIAVLSMGIKE